MSLRTITILMPVYNDWNSFARLVNDIDRCADEFKNATISIIAVDDGSTQQFPVSRNNAESYQYIQEISVLHLARNLGHQKAIALGIAYINSNVDCDFIIVMDADGEDRPEDIAKLLQESNKYTGHVIFARRTGRSEGVVFRAFYFFYKVFFYLLTGKQIAFGNFSLIPGTLLNRVAHLPEIWNHFAAGIMRANIPWSSIPTKRGMRYGGTSSMNFVTLVVHGLSAISVIRKS
jgi:glycosyltransferase involved in cell wall biosynthesis